MTGGSSSTWSEWDRCARPARPRARCCSAAAAQTGRSTSRRCRAEKGFVIHTPSGKRLSFGALAEAAAKLTPPAEVTLKDPKDFKLIGKPMPRLDTPDEGQRQGGVRHRRHAARHARRGRARAAGVRRQSREGFDDAKAKAVPGVTRRRVDSAGRRRGRDGLLGREARAARRWRSSGTWAPDASAVDGRPARAVSRAGRETPGLVAKNEGDAAAALASAAKTLEAEYEVPYLAHAPMEPLNCVVDLRADRCEIWTGTQFQTDRPGRRRQRRRAASPEQVQIHTTFLGGGFGRRADPVVRLRRSRPCEVAKAVEGAGQGGLDARGRHPRRLLPADVRAPRSRRASTPTARPWPGATRIVGQSIMAGTPFERS